MRFEGVEFQDAYSEAVYVVGLRICHIDTVAANAVPVKEVLCCSASLRLIEFLGARHMSHQCQVHSSPFGRPGVYRVAGSVYVTSGEVPLSSKSVVSIVQVFNDVGVIKVSVRVGKGKSDDIQ